MRYRRSGRGRSRVARPRLFRTLFPLGPATEKHPSVIATRASRSSRGSNPAAACCSQRLASGGGGYPSQTHVRRGDRVVQGDKELIEKLGRNDLCPCGSNRRFQELLHDFRRIRRERAEPLPTIDASSREVVTDCGHSESFAAYDDRLPFRVPFLLNHATEKHPAVIATRPSRISRGSNLAPAPRPTSKIATRRSSSEIRDGSHPTYCRSRTRIARSQT